MVQLLHVGCSCRGHEGLTGGPMHGRRRGSAKMTQRFATNRPGTDLAGRAGVGVTSTMRVTVRLGAPMDELVSHELVMSFDCDAVPLSEVLHRLVREHPELEQFLLPGTAGSTWDLVFPVVNAQAAEPDRAVSDGDVITLIPPFEGG